MHEQADIIQDRTDVIFRGRIYVLFRQCLRDAKDVRKKFNNCPSTQRAEGGDVRTPITLLLFFCLTQPILAARREIALEMREK